MISYLGYFVIFFSWQYEYKSLYIVKLKMSTYTVHKCLASDELYYT